MSIKVQGLSKGFFPRNAEMLLALENIDMVVRPGSFTCIVGPSGCGKTTLLRILAGLESATSGIFEIESRHNSNQSTPVAMVFQDFSRSLFPWYSVEKQLLIACRSLGIDADASATSIKQALEMTGLTPYSHLLPHELSGGMQQRVALARALVTRAKVLLMDEPFGSIDAHSRYQLEDHLLEIWRKQPSTILFVTHDVDEALYLADYVIVLSRRPATVVSEIQVSLPRPRSHAITRSLPEFGELRKMIWSDLYRDV